MNLFIVSGLALQNDDGSLSINLKMIPSEETLQKIWNPDSVLTFEDLHGELLRSGCLDKNNILNLTGKEIRSLYRFLERFNIIQPGLDMTAVYRYFAGTFQLNCKGAQSLQRLKDEDQDIERWSRFFARYLINVIQT
jgi:hypothetical protein